MVRAGGCYSERSRSSFSSLSGTTAAIAGILVVSIDGGIVVIGGALATVVGTTAIGLTKPTIHPQTLRGTLVLRQGSTVWLLGASGEDTSVAVAPPSRILGHPIIDFHTGHVYESSNPPQGLNYSTSNDAFIAATDMEVAVSQRSFRVDSRVALYSVSGRPTRLLRSSRRFSFSAPIVSPDGTRIAYQKTAYMIYGRGSSLTSSNSSLWVGPIDGCCDSRVLSNLRAWFVGGAPAWSPDGRFIASACAVPHNNHTLCIVDLTKHKFITPVSDLGSPSYPSWDPRGLKLAFIAARGGSSPDQEIYTYDLRSHRTTRLTDDAFGKTGLAWSPSGREIAYIGAGGVRLIPATRPDQMLGLLVRGDFNAVQWVQPSIAQ